MNTEITYEEIEGVLEQITGEAPGFEELVRKLIDEKGKINGKTIFSFLGEFFFGQFQGYEKVLLYLFLLILGAAILMAVTNAFQDHQITEMGFYMIYLLLVLVLVQVFGECYDITRQLILNLLDFMKVLMPAYLLAAAAASYRTTAVVYYEGFLLLVYYLQKLILYLILPGIKAYGLFCLAGYLSTKDFFSRGREQMKHMIQLVLKITMGAAVGIQFIQGMITPAIDSVEQTVVTKGISSLGSVGSVTEGVMDVILGSGILLKNGIGAAGAIFTIGISLVPAFRVGLYVILLQLLTAVTEPISDKRISGLISEMGDALALLVKLQFTVAALFLLILAVVCVTTGGLA